jgi:hypothetical protein
MLDDEQVRELANCLEQAVPSPPDSKDDFERETRKPLAGEAKVYISLITEDKYGESLGPNPGIKIVANRNGYLRLALQFLRAATDPSVSPTSSNLPMRWHDLLAKDSIRVSSLQRKEEGIEYPDTPEPPKTWSERAKGVITTIICVTSLLFFIVSAMAGCNTVLNWFSAPKLP